MTKLFKTLAVASLVAGILWASAGGAQAQTPNPPRASQTGSQTIFGSNYTLRSDEILNGDLTVFGGNATTQEGSVVTSDVFVLGGNVTIAGEVRGDVNVFGGNLTLKNSARVAGDVTSIGGNVNRDPGAVVMGSGNAVVPPIPAIPPIPPIPPMPARRLPTVRIDNDAGDVLGGIIGALLMVALSVGAWAVLPRRMEGAYGVAKSQMATSGVFGALSLVTFPIAVVIASVLLMITLIGIPVAILLLIAVGPVMLAAMLLGWALVARWLGEWLRVKLAQNTWSFTMTVAAGAGALALLGLIPGLGVLVGLLATSIGVGALMLTRFGTRGYPPGSRLNDVAPTPPTTGMAITPVVAASPLAPITNDGVNRDIANLP